MKKMKQDKFQMNNLSLQLKELEKEQIKEQTFNY